MEPHDEPDTLDSPGPDSGPATLGSSVPRGQAAPPLSAIEAAGVAGVNERTIRRAISAGQLPATKHRGAFRISPADLAAWQAEYEAGGPPDRAADTGPATDRTGPAPSGTDGPLGGSTVAELWRAIDREHAQALAAKNGEIAAKDETIAAKDQTINELAIDAAFLREQLGEAHRVTAIMQLRHAEVFQALTSVSGDQRQDAPTAAQEPPGATEGASEGDPSSWLATMLRKVRGG